MRSNLTLLVPNGTFGWHAVKHRIDQQLNHLHELNRIITQPIRYYNPDNNVDNFVKYKVVYNVYKLYLIFKI